MEAVQYQYPQKAPDMKKPLSHVSTQQLRPEPFITGDIIHEPPDALNVSHSLWFYSTNTLDWRYFALVCQALHSSTSSTTTTTAACRPAAIDACAPRGHAVPAEALCVERVSERASARPAINMGELQRSPVQTQFTASPEHVTRTGVSERANVFVRA